LDASRVAFPDGGDLRLHPKVVSYQGYLADSLGEAITDSVSMVFGIYDDPSAGTQLWTEPQDVEVVEGVFNVLLGSVTLIPDNVFTTGIDRWLQVDVEGEELAPRTRISSVAYAYTSTFSDTADYAHEGPGVADNDWIESDDVLYTGDYWGISKGNAGNHLIGNNTRTFTNLGANCTTGDSSSNYYHITIAGGYANSAIGSYTFLGGGSSNRILRTYATLGGGRSNSADSAYTAVLGGRYNSARANYATVVAGWGDTVRSVYGGILSGLENEVGDEYSDTAAVVVGGKQNDANGRFSFVGGGFMNMASGDYSTVSGGDENTASALTAAVGGGRENTASGQHSFVGGGYSNSASDAFTFVGGGFDNTASDFYATVCGGYDNWASGNASFAAGTRAKAIHDGAFVWSDNSSGDFYSTGTKQFLIRASGGVGIGTNSPQKELDVNGDILCDSMICDVMRLIAGSDIAEPFDIKGDGVAEPGMVLSIDPDNPGKLRISDIPYDRCVAGIVSGAGDVNPGLLMGQAGSMADGEYPVALTGRVYCYADASNGPIRPGDLLTTSGLPGHAMKVDDVDRAIGAVIGKAMTTLDQGTGLVLVLVNLQ
jgi:hypothetical protein